MNKCRECEEFKEFRTNLEKLIKVGSSKEIEEEIMKYAKLVNNIELIEKINEFKFNIKNLLNYLVQIQYLNNADGY